MTGTVRYREFHTLRWLTWGLGGISVVLLVYSILEGAPLGGWLVLGAFVGFFAAQFLAAIHRYNRITLTDTTLRVGKETFERSDFDFTFGVQPSLVLSPDEEERVAEEWKLPPDHELRVAGGGWGRRRGTTMVVLREANTDRVLAIFSRNPEKLDAVLTEWLEMPGPVQ